MGGSEGGKGRCGGEKKGRQGEGQGVREGKKTDFFFSSTCLKSLKSNEKP